MNLHDRFGFEYKRLLAGSWEFETTMNDRDYNEMPSLLVSLVNMLGFVLAERGLDPFQVRMLPFPDFSYAVVRTDDKVTVLFGRGPVQSVRYGLYYDVRREGHPMLGEAAIDQLKTHDLHWDNYLSADFPSDIMSFGLEQRDTFVREGARKMTDELTSKAAPDIRQVTLQPISVFPAGPFARRDKLCFVLMPFAKEFQDVYDYMIKPSVETAGLECRRADDIMESGDILAQIYRSLMEARVVIADLTGANGNVLYELGLAHMIGHQAILLTQTMGDVPFDLRQQRHIIYSLSPAGVQRATRQLQGALSATLKEPLPTRN
jgi:hypothetical protein